MELSSFKMQKLRQSLAKSKMQDTLLIFLDSSGFEVVSSEAALAIGSCAFSIRFSIC